jgi:hypothetical protein
MAEIIPFHTIDHKLNQKKTPWSESASELYRPSDRRLSEKLVPERGCHVVIVTDPPRAYSRISRPDVIDHRYLNRKLIISALNECGKFI